MTRINRPLVVLALGAWLASLAAAQTSPSAIPPPIPASDAPTPQAAGPALGTTGCDRCGKIEAIRQATTSDQWKPLGSVPSSADLGATSAAVYQIGKGFTNQGQVMIGAAGGAAYQTRPTQRNVTHWEIVVRMDDGSRRSVTQNYESLLQVGDRVRVFGTQLELVQ